MLGFERGTALRAILRQARLPTPPRISPRAVGKSATTEILLFRRTIVPHISRLSSTLNHALIPTIVDAFHRRVEKSSPPSQPADPNQPHSHALLSDGVCLYVLLKRTDSSPAYFLSPALQYTDPDLISVLAYLCLGDHADDIDWSAPPVSTSRSLSRKQRTRRRSCASRSLSHRSSSSLIRTPHPHSSRSAPFWTPLHPLSRRSR
ncbi:hypothetical protein C8R45DRAFT_58081 [Mycena sanguinolenta]|nr:hypothetical protein C8R45DRAFT_58081 [Mycena sanguinolenta]